MINLSSSKSSNTPLYIQIARSIREQINEGQIATGDALPSERDLCELTGASRVTIRKALGQLIEEGLLWRKQGSGTFVSERIVVPATYLGGFTEDARARRGAQFNLVNQELRQSNTGRGDDIEHINVVRGRASWPCPAVGR